MLVQRIKKHLQKRRAARQARRVTYARAERRVRRGAAYLDDVDPGWFRGVDAGTLELASGRSCVLGQLHGDFRVGLVRARLLTLSSAPRANLAPASFGFQSLPGLGEALQAQDYEHLGRAWRAAVRHRQQKDRNGRRTQENTSLENTPLAGRSVAAQIKAPRTPVAT